MKEIREIFQRSEYFKKLYDGLSMEEKLNFTRATEEIIRELFQLSTMEKS